MAELAAISPTGWQVFDTGDNFELYSPDGELKKTVSKQLWPQYVTALVLKWGYYAVDDPLGQETLKKYGKLEIT